MGRFIGGEAGHRSFFGGNRGGPRTVGLLVMAGIGVFVMMFNGVPGLITGVAGCLLVYLVTMGTHRGSVLQRWVKRRRWNHRKSSGTDVFVPYTGLAMDEAKNRAGAAGTKNARNRILNAVRSRPDGADGMGWLRSTRRTAGIGWHLPVGEDPYLSVAFSVDGQLRGLASAREQDEALTGFDRLLAGFAPDSMLVSGIETMTRILPPDLALNEWWAQQHMDPAAPAAAVASYEQVLARTGEGAFVQRHYVVVRWNLAAAFKAEAARYGHGRSGWRALMDQEIATVTRELSRAHYRHPAALTARQTVAVILHQQNPSRPIQSVRDVDVTGFGIASRDEWAAHVVESVDPATGEAVAWWHRTAAITAEQMQTGERSQFWLLSLLIGAGAGIRTVSFKNELIPAAEAAVQAGRDLVKDISDQEAKADEGKLADQHTTAGRRAAQIRRADLAPGTGIHGANWVGYVTVTARSREELHRASRRLAETCANQAGIGRLEWMDTFQAAASGTTWPIFRGLAPAKKSIGSKAMDRLAGRAGNEEKVSASR